MDYQDIQNKIDIFLSSLLNEVDEVNKSRICTHEKEEFENWTGNDNTKDIECLLVKEHLRKMLAKNEFIKYEPRTHINWQPFDPENPPTNKDAGYLVEAFNGGFVHCFATGKCFFVGGRIIDFKMVKAYAIINPSKF